MGCDIGRIVPRWLLSTLNFMILMLTFLLLLVAVLLVTVPQYMRDLVLYIISRERLEVSLVTQEAISHNLGPSLLSQLGWASLSLGLVLLTPAFIGYVGAVRESRLCLIAYFAPIVIIWSVQLTFLIVLPVLRGPLYSWLARLATLSLELYKEPGNLEGAEEEEEDTNLVTFLWNIVMVHLECCGVNSYQDFQQSPQWSATRHKLQILPSACCMLETRAYPISRIHPVDLHCTAVPTKYNSYWTQGCLPRAASIASDYTSVIILVIISLLTLEILVIILACCLCLLQKYRGNKTLHTVIVKKESAPAPPARSHNDRNNWQDADHKNLIYNDMRNDIMVP